MRLAPLNGIFHEITTFLPTIVVDTGEGLYGTVAVNMYAISEKAPKPISLRARYLRR